MDNTENVGVLTVRTESAFGAFPVKDATVSVGKCPTAQSFLRCL